MEPNEKKRILIICTGNSCRSQMAEGFAHQAGWESFSSGTKPESEVNPFAVKVMAEIDIDISHHTPKSVNGYLSDDFYLVATVCDNASETCPVFTGNYEHKIHNSFKDPANAKGNDREITEVYCLIRDEIQIWMNVISEKYLNT